MTTRFATSCMALSLMSLMISGCGARFSITSFRAAQGAAVTPMASLHYGVAMSALEGSPDTLPGHLNGEVFTIPESHFSYYESKGLKHARIEGIWERMQPTLNGALGEQLLDHYSDPTNPLRNPVALVHYYLDFADAHHLKVVLDLAHNFGGRYIGYDGDWDNPVPAELGTTDLPISALTDYNVKLVQEFGSHPAVVAIEIMNEPHDLTMGESGWVSACQQSIDAIRAVNSDITIVVDGYGWASAHWWQSNNPTLHTLTDPQNKLIFTAHQYFDDSEEGFYTGSEATAPNGTDYDIGSDHIQPFIDWLNAHGLQNHGIIGEFGAPNEPQWSEIVRRTMITAAAANLPMTAHQDVPYTDDPYVMNLYPRTTEVDRDMVNLLQSITLGTALLNTPYYP